MLRIEHVLGSRLAPELSEALHRLAHRGAIDVVHVPSVDLERRRLLISTCSGEKLAIALPRNQKLFDGAVLLLDDVRAIVVRAAPERWLRLEPHSIRDAVELGYHVGNLHWRVRFAGEALLVALEAPPEEYMARLEGLIQPRRIGMTILDDETSNGDVPVVSDVGPTSPRPHSRDHSD
jgi:urease accessory protein